MRRLICALLATAAAAAPAHALPQGQFYPAGPSADVLMLPAVVAQYRAELGRLRQDAIAQQAADGGTLSQPSRVRLQERLDRLNALHVRHLRRADFFTVDAAGRVVR